MERACETKLFMYNKYSEVGFCLTTSCDTFLSFLFFDLQHLKSVFIHLRQVENVSMHLCYHDLKVVSCRVAMLSGAQKYLDD